MRNLATVPCDHDAGLRTAKQWVSHHGAALMEALHLAETNHPNVQWDKLMLRWNGVHPLGKVDPVTLARQCASLRISSIRAAITSVHVLPLIHISEPTRPY